MTAENNDRYVSPAGVRDRKRTKRCPYDNAELDVRAGFVWCPSCGKTADEMALEVTR